MISHFDDVLGTKYLIINYDGEDTLDISAVFALEDIIVRLKSQHIEPILVSNRTVLEQLESLSIIKQIGTKNVFQDENSAILYAKSKLKYEK